MNYIVLIKMFFKSFIICNLKIPKHLSRINILAVIRSQHICSHRFTKTTRAAYTYILILSIQLTVCKRNQTCFINIYLRIDCLFIFIIPRIQIYSHYLCASFCIISINLIVTIFIIQPAFFNKSFQIIEKLLLKTNTF